MRKLYKILLPQVIAILFTIGAIAQAPEKMSYQAVIRNNSNDLIINTTVGMKISIVQGSQSGFEVYAENQMPTTNANGLVSIEIGSGTVLSGTFADINWEKGPYFINTEIDPAGGTNYKIQIINQLLSVPYALYSKTAGEVSLTPAQLASLKGDKGDKGADGLTTSVNGVTQVGGAITLTKADIGLANIDNTADIVKPISKPTQISLNLKVDKVTGKGLSTSDYTDAEKTKLAGIAAGAEVNVNADWNATSGDALILNKPTIPAAANGSETKIGGGTNIKVTGAGTFSNPYVVNTRAFVIGQSYQGGTIFWLDESGQHGLIAATTNLGLVVKNYIWSDPDINAMRDGIRAGIYNTERIIKSQGGGVYAAQLCANYKGGGYGDWYLPSKYELNLLYQQQNMVGGFAGDYFWSSYGDCSTCMWRQGFLTGTQTSSDAGDKANVRAIRAF
jgi:hypothetical protein